jgi:hypothetical protein
MFTVTKRSRKVAKKVTDNALPIQQGEVVVFYAGIENLDLAYAFAAECESGGNETIVQSCGDYINYTKFSETPLHRSIETTTWTRTDKRQKMMIRMWP